ncbi:hypothetical protein Hanom_Chr05g00472381 [Helianthus anomalus]
MHFFYLFFLLFWSYLFIIIQEICTDVVDQILSYNSNIQNFWSTFFLYNFIFIFIFVGSFFVVI